MACVRAPDRVFHPCAPQKTKDFDAFLEQLPLPARCEWLKSNRSAKHRQTLVSLSRHIEQGNAEIADSVRIVFVGKVYPRKPGNCLRIGPADRTSALE